MQARRVLRPETMLPEERLRLRGQAPVHRAAAFATSTLSDEVQSYLDYALGTGLDSLTFWQVRRTGIFCRLLNLTTP